MVIVKPEHVHGLKSVIINEFAKKNFSNYIGIFVNNIIFLICIYVLIAIYTCDKG